MNPLVVDAGAVGAVMGWLQAIKGFMPEKAKKFLPVLAVVLGVAYAFLMRPGCSAGMECAVVGLGIGLSASGLFSGVKNGLEGAAKKPSK